MQVTIQDETRLSSARLATLFRLQRRLSITQVSPRLSIIPALAPSSGRSSSHAHAAAMQVDVDARAAKIKKGEVSLGTSIMACAFKDGVVIGADSRTTMGSYIVRARCGMV